MLSGKVNGISPKAVIEEGGQLVSFGRCQI